MIHIRLSDYFTASYGQYLAYKWDIKKTFNKTFKASVIYI